MSSVDLNASGCSIAQEALNIIKRLDDKKSGLFYFLLRINMSYKIQETFEWFEQFNKIDIKIKGETKEFNIELENKNLPHLLGLQYINSTKNDVVMLKGRRLYNYIKFNKLSDEEILEKIKNNSPSMEESVKSRIETFQEFMENIEKSYILEKTYLNTTIKSNYLIVQSKGEEFLHLGVKQNQIASFDIIPKKDSWLETYFSRDDIKYFQNSKIIEEVKGLYKYNNEKERFETFTFNDKRIEKTKEVEDFDIPKKTKVNNKSNER